MTKHLQQTYNLMLFTQSSVSLYTVNLKLVAGIYSSSNFLSNSIYWTLLGKEKINRMVIWKGMRVLLSYK